MIHKILASLKQWDIPFHWEHISMTEQYRCFQIYTVLCRVILGLILQLPCWIHFIIFQHFIVYCIFGRHFSSLEQNIYLFQIKFSKFANSSIHSEVLQMVHRTMDRCVVFPFFWDCLNAFKIMFFGL